MINIHLSADLWEKLNFLALQHQQSVEELLENWINGETHKRYQVDRTESVYQDVLEKLPLPIAITRRDNNQCVFINVAFRQLLGVSDNLTDVTLLDMSKFYQNPSDQAIFLQEIRNNQAVCGNEWRMVKADGTLLVALGWAYPIQYHGHACVVMSMMDITHRKQLEHETLNTYKQLQELSQMRTGFISMLTHEFRNLFATMTVELDILMKNVQNPILSTDERRRYLDKLQRQVKRLGRLTDGLTFLHTLDVARQGEFIPRSIHLRKFIEECIEEIQHNYPYVHTFEIVGQGDCTYVYVDDNLLYQILIHLLSNAVKYSAPQHPITIKCDCTHPTELYLEIEDHGVGIPQGEQAHIFAPFYRAQNVKHIEGSGLGLTTVEKAVQICGGSLGFVSEENRGSRFWVRVPRLNSQGDG